MVLVSNREDWKPLLCKKIRPTKYIIIKELGPSFDEAITRIEAEEQIGIAFTGINLSRAGTLCWIQVFIFVNPCSLVHLACSA